jgi:hypothetical protein
MADPSGIDVSAGDVVALAGTSKGLFALTSGPDRQTWAITGPWPAFLSSVRWAWTSTATGAASRSAVTLSTWTYSLSRNA